MVPRRTQQTITRAGFASVIGGHIVFLLASVLHDAGVFLTIGVALNKGLLPYADLIDHKPPGIYYTLALAWAIWPSVFSGKVLILLVNLATAGLLVKVGERFRSKRVGLLAAWLWLVGLLIYEGVFIFTEQFVAFFGVLALVFLFQSERRRWRDLLLTGGALGIGILYKQTAILLAGGAGLYFLIRAARARELPVRPAIGISVGFAVPILVAVGFFWSQGAADSFLQWVVFANDSDYANESVQGLVQGNFRAGMMFILVWLASIAGVIKTALTRDLEMRFLLSVLFLFSLLPLVIRSHEHYYIQALPFAVLLAADVVLDLRTEYRLRADSETIQAVSLAVGIVFVGGVLFGLTVPVYHTANGGVFEQQDVAEAVIENSEEGADLAVLNASPVYYVLTDRVPPEEHFYFTDANRRQMPDSAIEDWVTSGEIDIVVLHSPCSDRTEEACTAVEENFELVEEHGSTKIYVKN